MGACPLSYAAITGTLRSSIGRGLGGGDRIKKTCAYAAKNVLLEVLQWAQAHGCPRDEDTCAYAAKNGHLEVLQ